MRRNILLGAVMAAGGLWVASACAAAKATPDVVGQMGLKPGRWHSSFRVVDVTLTPLPGQTIPADVEAGFRSKIGQEGETDDCIKSKRLPNEGLTLPGISMGPDCVLDVVADKQALKLHASCGTYAVVDVSATHSDTAMAADIVTLASPSGVAFTVKVIMASKSSYVGACS